jgi:hypothetical protein
MNSKTIIEFGKGLLSKIGGPVWRAVQSTKHSTLGAIVLLLCLVLIIWVMN